MEKNNKKYMFESGKNSDFSREQTNAIEIRLTQTKHCMTEDYANTNFSFLNWQKKNCQI